MSTQEAFSFEEQSGEQCDDVIDGGVDERAELDEAAAEPAEPIVEIRASARRRRTVTAYREGDRTIVLVPARMSVRERERHAAELVERLRRRDARTRRSDDDLMKRAAQLSRKWLGGQ